ncbi:hypothetical protein FISHEDRAFT_68277 [Fistulina hepatica ATCC 64428]|uniref:Uncharacterized protein n=1 Tax=Fistulina hepatica ATCC 64428 TaxID=1128425 RepID=A0A0D7A0I4_9AGAR|nr:hypothetical protein FISHEDRAFT_68277 [Fistulina hepatica ATCC 64428]
MAIFTPRSYSCKCLNVCIREQPSRDVPANPPAAEAHFTTLFVDQSGIEVVHPQLTFRNRARNRTFAHSTDYSRYTSVTCLVCQCITYRVNQLVSSDVEGKEGPVLPTDGWAEDQVLHSADGWIEVHESCLTGDGIERLKRSPRYSPLFSIVLPELTSPLISAEPIPESPTPSPSQQPCSFFSDVPPVFPPAPFTISHPVFQHLAGIAKKKSDSLRAAAHAKLEAIVKTEIAEVQHAELALRNDVELLWHIFRSSVTQHQLHSSSSPHSLLSDENGSSVTHTREFVPTASIQQHPSLPPRMSSLSASLAASGFHHPRAGETPSPPTSPSSTPSAAEVGSLATSSSITMTFTALPIHPRTAGTAASVLQLQRNVDESLNVATSIQVRQLEEEMAKRHQELQEAKRHSLLDRSSALTGNGKSPGQSNTTVQAKEGDAPATHDPTSPKGKRKVTFDIQPTVATVPREQPVATENVKNSDDLLFDLEEEDELRPGTPPVLPFREPSQTSPPPRPSRRQAASSDNAFASLRPASLPAPSNVSILSSAKAAEQTDGAPNGDATIPAAMESPEGIASSSAVGAGLEPSHAVHHLSPPPRPLELYGSDDEAERGDDVVAEMDPREEQVRKLLAAGVASHRSAWKRDGNAWQMFLRRRAEHGQAEEVDEEFNELDELHAESVHVGSLPIAIRSPPGAPSLASYQPKTSLTDRANTFVPRLPKRPTSFAYRKAMYAERDQLRDSDPGALDFAVADDDDDDDSKCATIAEDGPQASGRRSREHALKILEARSRVPEEGMWRSLAN